MITLTDGMISGMAKVIAERNKTRACYIAKFIKGEHAGKYVGRCFNPVQRGSAFRMCTTDPKMFLMSAPVKMDRDDASFIELIQVRKGTV
jgi:hypothetical protein